MRQRAGLSLLEVMLALAILGGALAAILQLIRLGSRSAVDARELTTAQLLCEAKLAEITTGILPPDPGGPFEFDMQEHAQWVFYVDTQPVSQAGLLQVSVTVVQDREDEARPLAFSLVRWMQDPAVELAAVGEAPEASDTSSGGGASSGTSDGAGAAGPGAGNNQGGGQGGNQGGQGGGPGGGGPGGGRGGGQGGPGGGRGGPGGGGPGAGGQDGEGGGRGGPGGGRGGQGGGRGGGGGGGRGGGGGGQGGGNQGGPGGGFGGFGGGGGGQNNGR